MTKKHKIEYLPVAKQDLIDILDYVSQEAPITAIKLIEKGEKFEQTYSL